MQFMHNDVDPAHSDRYVAAARFCEAFNHLLQSGADERLAVLRTVFDGYGQGLKQKGES